jgi:hypothetical protein
MLPLPFSAVCGSDVFAVRAVAALAARFRPGHFSLPGHGHLTAPDDTLYHSFAVVSFRLAFIFGFTFSLVSVFRNGLLTLCFTQFLTLIFDFVLSWFSAFFETLIYF